MPNADQLSDRILHYLAETGEAAQAHLLGTGAVKSLETKLATCYQMPHATAVSSATSGLLGVAQALGLCDSEIVTTPWTYGGTVAPFLLLNNRILFADVDPETLTLDPESARRAITPNTRAIVAADVYGVPCDVKGLRKLADDLGLWLIVDGAQSFGAWRDGIPAGSAADAVVLSFGPGKGLFAGEGGAVLTNDQILSEHVVWVSQHGYRHKFQINLHLDNEFAMNGRIHPLAAIWADETLERSLQAVTERRERGYAMVEKLNQTGLTQIIDYESRSIEPSFDRLTAAWKFHAEEVDLCARLRESGTDVEIRRTPVRLLYQQPAFLEQYQERLVATPQCPVAEDQARRRFEIHISLRAEETEAA